jgi:putative ABC transport system ATP-binding protein
MELGLPEPIMVFQNVVKNRSGGSGYSLLVEDLIVCPADRYALIGDSGSGKSTLLDLMALILKPDSAESFLWQPKTDSPIDLFKAWQDKDTCKFEKIRREQLGYVMQTGGLLPFLSVEDNILLPGQLKNCKPKEQKNLLNELAKILKISELLKRKPALLSVGQRQRCAIARALIHEPSLILADEPTASLDPPTARQVLELLLALSKERALVISTHNLDLIKDRGFTVFRIFCQQPDTESGVLARLELIGQ